MRSRAFVFVVVLFTAAAAEAQDWRVFSRGALFLTYVTETGPKKPEKRGFSTNWLIVGAERASGRGSILFRGRFSAEPLTVPDKGYPQLLQYVSAVSGGPLLDHMRAQDAVQEVAVQVWWRALRLYAAPVGEPALGATPFAQRKSSVDFAEAPFAYDVQESFHAGTRVVTAAIATDPFTLEGGVFHASHTTGRHSSINDGVIDSWSARATIHPAKRVALQLSHGRLGHEKRKVTSASISYEGEVLAASAIWTRREPLTAISLETSIRLGAATLLGRAENVDRPAGVFDLTAQKRVTHLTLGYLFDVIRRDNFRSGIGVNIDYRTNTKSLQAQYGHKPQGIYTFIRIRTP